MRTIKFRAWHKVRQEMYLTYSISQNHVFKDTFDGPGCDGVPDKMEDVELMQFTGLTDKNSVEIYEGDIVNIWKDDEYSPVYLYGVNEVIYHKDLGGFGFPARYDNGYKCPIENYMNMLWQAEYMEVLGNIHQNPELLQ